MSSSEPQPTPPTSTSAVEETPTRPAPTFSIQTALSTVDISSTDRRVMTKFWPLGSHKRTTYDEPHHPQLRQLFATELKRVVVDSFAEHGIRCELDPRSGSHERGAWSPDLTSESIDDVYRIELVSRQHWERGCEEEDMYFGEYCKYPLIKQPTILIITQEEYHRDVHERIWRNVVEGAKRGIDEIISRAPDEVLRTLDVSVEIIHRDLFKENFMGAYHEKGADRQMDEALGLELQGRVQQILNENPETRDGWHMIGVFSWGPNRDTSQNPNVMLICMDTDQEAHSWPLVCDNIQRMLDTYDLGLGLEMDYGTQF